MKCLWVRQFLRILVALCVSELGEAPLFAQEPEYRAVRLISLAGSREIYGFSFGKLVGYRIPAGGVMQAAMWDVTTGEEVFLRSANMGSTLALGVLGDTYLLGDNLSPALLDVTTGKVTSLTLRHPYSGSSPIFSFGGRHVGSAAYLGTNHAILWGNSRTEFVDLHDASRYRLTAARAVSYGIEAGTGAPLGKDNAIHALMWRGSAQSLTDLHPPASLATGNKEPFVFTRALGASEDQVVGMGTTSDRFVNQALLWVGAADRWVNLHPSGAQSSEARGVRHGVQIGVASLNGRSVAALWRGSAASFVNLHLTLTAAGITATGSRAEVVDEFGTVAGYSLGAPELVLWTPQRSGEPPALKVSRMHLPQGWMVFQADVVSGKTYRAEMSSDLNSWAEVRTARSATGLFYAWIKSSEIVNEQFFRVVQVD